MKWDLPLPDNWNTDSQEGSMTEAVVNAALESGVRLELLRSLREWHKHASEHFTPEEMDTAMRRVAQGERPEEDMGDVAVLRQWVATEGEAA